MPEAGKPRPVIDVETTSESFDDCQSGNAISQREYAALYAKACLYRMLAFELAEKYDEEMFNTIEAVQYIDGKNV